MNSPFGMNDPSLLPMMLRQKMAPGMIPGPVAPQKLMPGFRAPAMGGAPGIAPQPQAGMPQVPGFGAFPSMRPPGWVPESSGAEPGRTTGDADLGGYGGSPVDPMAGNPNAQAAEVFNPSGQSKGGSFFSFLKGLF